MNVIENDRAKFFKERHDEDHLALEKLKEKEKQWQKDQKFLENNVEKWFQRTQQLIQEKQDLEKRKAENKQKILKYWKDLQEYDPHTPDEVMLIQAVREDFNEYFEQELQQK